MGVRLFGKEWLGYRDDDGTFSRKPVCSILLLGTRDHASIRVVVDSGADISIFPESAAKEAGVDLSHGKKCLTEYVGSSDFGILMTNMHIIVRGRRLPIDAVFVPDAHLIGIGYALLGRRGVFNQFASVTFQEKFAPYRVEFRR